MGVTVVKKIKNIINGETILPNRSPNFNHSIFGKINIFGIKKEIINNIKLIIIAQYLTGSLFSRGYKATIIKKTEKTIPKFFSEPILISK